MALKGPPPPPPQQQGWRPPSSNQTAAKPGSLVRDAQRVDELADLEHKLAVQVAAAGRGGSNGVSSEEQAEAAC